MDEGPEQRNAQNPQNRPDPRKRDIIGAAIEVHSTLGSGYLERVYHEALALELKGLGIPFRSEVEVPIWYKGIPLGVGYRADLLCFGDLLVELKAQESIGRVDAAQVINYLKAGRIPVGLLLNFGEPILRIKRFAGPEHFRPSR
jgi:GxxExxY protein